MYEFLMSQPPFLCFDLHDMFNNIKFGNLKFHKDISNDAKDLI